MDRVSLSMRSQVGSLRSLHNRRSFSALINTALEKDLRPDLEEGFSTGRISPRAVADMTSRDLATATTLEQMNKLDAQSIKATVRYEDDYGPARYTKKNLEDADALQAIHDNLAESARRERGEKEVEPEVVAAQVQRETEEDELRGIQDQEQTPDEVGDDHDTKERVGTPEALDNPAPAPETPRPAPQLVQTQQRQSSFSLTSVWGTHPSAPIETLPQGEDDEDDQGSGGFNDGSIDENMENDNGSEIDYSGSREKEAEKVAAPAEPSVQEILDKLPVVWSGSVSDLVRSDDVYRRLIVRLRPISL